MVIAKPGSTHTSWNLSDEPAHLRIQMRPALRWQEFVERLFALAEEGPTDENNQPRPEAVTALIKDFPDEIAPPR